MICFNISKGLIYADLLTARQALSTYKENPKLKDLKNICAYHLQQATEKLIKSQIFNSGFQYNNRDLYTHDIAALISYIEKNEMSVKIPKMHFSIRVDTLERHLRIINEWFDSLN